MSNYTWSMQKWIMTLYIHIWYMIYVFIMFSKLTDSINIERIIGWRGIFFLFAFSSSIFLTDGFMFIKKAPCRWTLLHFLFKAFRVLIEYIIYSDDIQIWYTHTYTYPYYIHIHTIYISILYTYPYYIHIHTIYISILYTYPCYLHIHTMIFIEIWNYR